MTAGALLAGIAADLPPIGLDGVPELMSRVDRKYLVPLPVLAGLAAELRTAGFAVLEIGGRRRFRYRSTYFDTAELLSFRHHRQGRRRRFKIRTRVYLDGGGRWLEVKLSGARSGTDKHRMPYPAPHDVLDYAALDFVSDTLLRGLRVRPPDGLLPSLVTEYRRITLVDPHGGARLTCDTDLVCRDATGVARARDEYVLVESKSRGGRAYADAVLRRLGARPVPVSKYCLGVARLRRLPANRWRPVLRRFFDGVPG